MPGQLCFQDREVGKAVVIFYDDFYAGFFTIPVHRAAWMGCAWEVWSL